MGYRGQDTRQRRGESLRKEYNGRHDAGIVYIRSRRVEAD